MLARDSRPFVYSLLQRKGRGSRPPTKPSTSGQSIGVGYVHRLKRNCGASPHVLLMCVMFACVMAARGKMSAVGNAGGLLLKPRPHLQSQPCEQKCHFQTGWSCPLQNEQAVAEARDTSNTAIGRRWCRSCHARQSPA